MLATRVPDQLADEVQAIASSHGMPVSSVVRMAIELLLASRKQIEQEAALIASRHLFAQAQTQAQNDSPSLSDVIGG